MNRLKNVMKDNPSITVLMNDVLVNGSESVAEQVYRYPPHIAALLVQSMVREDYGEGRINEFVNALTDCCFIERDTFF